MSHVTTNFTTTVSIATSSDGSPTISTNTNDDARLQKMLSYTVPLSLLGMLVLIVIIITIRNRRRILNKWNPIKRMKNTNPKFLQDTGLRRDSEFDSHNHDHTKPTIENVQPSVNQEQEYHLTTIS